MLLTCIQLQAGCGRGDDAAGHAPEFAGAQGVAGMMVCMLGSVTMLVFIQLQADCAAIIAAELIMQLAMHPSLLVHKV
jgi:hypothetical protein